MNNDSAHSREFIEEMKKALLRERQDISSELKGLAHKEKGDFQANFPDYGRNDEESVSEFSDYEAANATTEAIEARLKDIEAAIERIERGTYGTTDEGEIIPEARLRANPAATTLVGK
ncbi:MAG: hypothetical protein WD200_01840 [Candidatus Andersenbacteria bacterium]